MKIFENTMPPASRALLENLNGEIQRQSFYLAGGSGLALQIGHRLSEDLDLFTPKEFKPELLGRYLNRQFNYQEIMVAPGTLYCNLNQVKVSFIYYEILLIYPLFNFKKIKVANWRDILAEKFKTLSQRGSRKDFYDIYFVISTYNLTIADSVKIFKSRFKKVEVNYYHILKSLAFFEEAEQEPDLLLLKEVPWETVKSFFLKHLREFEKYLLK